MEQSTVIIWSYSSSRAIEGESIYRNLIASPLAKRPMFQCLQSTLNKNLSTTLHLELKLGYVIDFVCMSSQSLGMSTTLTAHPGLIAEISYFLSIFRLTQIFLKTSVAKRF